MDSRVASDLSDTEYFSTNEDELVKSPKTSVKHSETITGSELTFDCSTDQLHKKRKNKTGTRRGVIRKRRLSNLDDSFEKEEEFSCDAHVLTVEDVNCHGGKAPLAKRIRMFETSSTSVDGRQKPRYLENWGPDERWISTVRIGNEIFSRRIRRKSRLSNRRTTTPEEKRSVEWAVPDETRKNTKLLVSYSDSDSDTSESESSLRPQVIVESIVITRISGSVRKIFYSSEEKQRMLDWVCEKEHGDRKDRVMSISLYDEMVEAKICPKRTAQSLSNTFRRYILTALDDFKIDGMDKKQLENRLSRLRTSAMKK